MRECYFQILTFPYFIFVGFAINSSQLHVQKHMLTKMEHLILGANMNMCLERMRERAYLIQQQERAEEHSKPTWSVCVWMLHCRYIN